MTPLIILLSAFIIIYAADWLFAKRRIGLSLTGRISMSLMLLATGIAHFANPRPMVEMMPGVIPAKTAVVYFTGVCEFAAVVGLLLRRYARTTSVLLIIFFVAVLPANIVGSINQVPLGGMEAGPVYLIFRIPLQILFIVWVYYFGIRKV